MQSEYDSGQTFLGTTIADYLIGWRWDNNKQILFYIIKFE